MNKQKMIVIVDAYSSGNLIAPAWKDLGYGAIHVQSTETISECDLDSFKPADFQDNIFSSNDESLVKALSVYEIEYVLCGSESGVILAERLAELLGCPINDSKTSLIRRNKFYMIDELQKNKVPAVRQRLCKNREDAYDFASSEGELVVLKPLESAGSDGIFFCNTPTEAAEAFDAVSGHPNIFGAINDGVVIQSYLDGFEYYVNTVSLDSVHHVCEFWRITHIAINNLENMQDSSTLMHAEGEIQRQLQAYAFKCLDVLGVKNGPAHLEIKMTSTGPKLIEMGARICGGPLGRSAKMVLESCQMDMAIKALLNPTEFLCEAGTPYQNNGTVSVVGLLSPVAGKLNAYPKIEALRALESFEELVEIYEVGSQIYPTTDDEKYPMMVILKNKDEAAIERDSRTVRYLDGVSFYDVA